MPSAGVERGGGAAIGGDIAYVGGRGVLLRKNRENVLAGILFVQRGARAIYLSWARANFNLNLWSSASFSALRRPFPELRREGRAITRGRRLRRRETPAH